MFSKQYAAGNFSKYSYLQAQKVFHEQFAGGMLNSEIQKCNCFERPGILEGHQALEMSE